MFVNLGVCEWVCVCVCVCVSVCLCVCFDCGDRGNLDNPSFLTNESDASNTPFNMQISVMSFSKENKLFFYGFMMSDSARTFSVTPNKNDFLYVNYDICENFHCIAERRKYKVMWSPEAPKLAPSV